MPKPMDTAQAEGEDSADSFILKRLKDKSMLGNHLLDALALGIGVVYGFYGPDMAKIGQLYLQDGMWGNERLLPEGWVEFVSTPGPAQPDPGFSTDPKSWNLQLFRTLYDGTGLSRRFMGLDFRHSY